MKLNAVIAVVCVASSAIGCGSSESSHCDALDGQEDRPQAVESSVFPLSVGPTKRYLVDKHGKPFLINGDTAWSLIAQLTREEAEQYLEDRAQKQFNAVLVSLLEHKFADNAPDNADGQSPFRSPGDFSQPCEAYFRHADWVINRASEKGLLVVLCYCYLGYEGGPQGWAAEIKQNGVSKCRSFGQFLGQRYKNTPNIVWLAGGDGSAAECGVLDEVNAIAQGIKEVDKAHLHSAHCSRQKSAVDCYHQPWLDINTTYSDCDQTLARLAIDYQRSDVLPFIYVEGKYENEGASATCLRSQAYWTVLSGGCGHFFGNSPIWGFGAGWKSAGRDWKSALDSAGAGDMTRWAQLFASRPWHLLAPDVKRTVVASDTAGVAAAVSRDKSTIIAYLPSQAQVSVDLSQLSGREVVAWWYHPSLGRADEIGTFPSDGTRAFTPPSGGDWALVLDDPSFQYPVPGSGVWKAER